MSRTYPGQFSNPNLRYVLADRIRLAGALARLRCPALLPRYFRRLPAQCGTHLLGKVGDGALPPGSCGCLFDVAARRGSLSFRRHASSYRARLKNCTARSCRLAFSRDVNVPRFRRRPVRLSTFREYRRYSPDFSFRIMSEGMRCRARALPFSRLARMASAHTFRPYSS